MASINDSLKIILEKLGGTVPDEASNAELVELIAEEITAADASSGGEGNPDQTTEPGQP